MRVGPEDVIQEAALEYLESEREMGWGLREGRTDVAVYNHLAGRYRGFIWRAVARPFVAAPQRAREAAASSGAERQLVGRGLSDGVQAAAEAGEV